MNGRNQHPLAGQYSPLEQFISVWISEMNEHGVPEVQEAMMATAWRVSGSGLSRQ